jgi:hypothetical protein
VGGGVGQLSSGTITGCSSLAGSFDVSKTTSTSSFFTGGFLGYADGGTVKDSYSNNPVVVNASTGFTGNVIGGGFIGSLRSGSTITHCYALGDISVSGSSAIWAGGFAGSTSGSASYCYASGNVNAYKKGTSGNSYVGGFAGRCYSMNDCYALGDVFVDVSVASSSPIYAGALSGLTVDTINCIFQRCFAKGSVTLQRNSTTGGNDRAGGLMGGIYTGSQTLRDCAALGPSVTITGGATRYIGRVYGSTEGATPTRQNNHAYNAMLLYSDDNYGAAFPKLRWDAAGDNKATTDDAGGMDGADAHLGDFRSSTFWQGLNFSTGWDFNNVGLKGYPRLLASNGTVMGGQ